MFLPTSAQCLTCWLSHTNHWILRAWHSKSTTLRQNIWFSMQRQQRVSGTGEQELRRLAMQPQKTSLEPHAEGRSSEHPQVISSWTDRQLALGALQTHRPDKQCDQDVVSPAFSLMTDAVTNLHTKNTVQASAQSFLHHRLLS